MSKMQPTRELAKKEGHLFYQTGKVCRNGHLCERYTSTGSCVKCNKARANTIGAKANMRRYYQANREKKIACSNAWKANHPERVKGYRIAKYGVTFEQYSAMLVLQNHCCAACGESLDLAKHTHQDHCHVTEKARGIICNKCNLVIGLADDSPDKLVAIANYLRGFL